MPARFLWQECVTNKYYLSFSFSFLVNIIQAWDSIFCLVFYIARVFDNFINLSSEKCLNTLLVMPVGGMRTIPEQCNARLCCDIHFSDVDSWHLMWCLMQCPSQGLTGCNPPYCAHCALHMLDWPKNKTSCDGLSRNVFGWIYLFTESAPMGRFSHRVAMLSVFLSVSLFAPSDAFF